MKRRKKAVYIDYDYEAAYQKMLTDLEEDNMCRMLNEGRVRSIAEKLMITEVLNKYPYQNVRRTEAESGNYPFTCYES